MEPAINLYSSNEKSELIRENSQEILSVLAAHQIALWEYDIITGKCSFSNDYFFTLGLKDAGIIFEDIDDFYRFIHPEDIESYGNNRNDHMNTSHHLVGQLELVLGILAYHRLLI